MSDTYDSDSLEPDIADLLDDSLTPSGDAPDFSQLMGLREESQEEPEITITEEFQKISQFEQPPQKYFYDPSYYKIALSGEGEVSEKLHKVLARFLKADNNEDKSIFRTRVISAYWEYLRSLACKVSANMKLSKKLTLRFGALIPTLISPKQRDMISRIIVDNQTGEPVYYIDEWLMNISLGRVSPLATDEVAISKQSTDSKLKGSLEKARGSQESNIVMIQKLQMQRKNLETSLNERLGSLCQHCRHRSFSNLETTMSDAQRKSIPRINQMLAQLSKNDREMKIIFEKLTEKTKDLQHLNNRVRELGGESAVDTDSLARETDSLRKMTKLCVGRQGNHFPILMKHYFSSNLQFVGTRENIIAQMMKIEAIDPGAFTRTFRQNSNRIVPNVIILPCFGDQGICWEPFEKFNKGTSRGRLALPLFPKDLKYAVLAAVGDLRWQVAKEKAAHYWMEEGITGHYYDWFTKNKLRGDVKDKFIEDYCLWIDKESEGLQKLDKDVRAIFWRLMPFPQEKKDLLKNRGFAYAELCKKDKNRAMSDGY
jgi:hypothetical protein